MSRLVALLSVVLASDGCIYVPSHSKAPVSAPASDLDPKRSVESFMSGPFVIHALIYRRSEFPLEVFFERLAHGDFRDALRAFNLRYSPSNTDNKELKKLLDRGFVPVLVNVTNAGERVEDSGKLHLQLRTSSGLIDPIPSAALPEEFWGISWKAVPANLYNTTVVVVGIAAVLASTAYGGVAGLYLSTGIAVKVAPKDDTTPTPKSGGDTGLWIWNSFKKTTELDYDAYLLNSLSLRPGDSETGLVFFHVPGGVVNWSDLQLVASR